MCLYDVIAASHGGQCFDILSRRFRIPEEQVALGVGHLVKALLPAIDRWIVDRDGLTQFLKLLCDPVIAGAREDIGLYSNLMAREKVKDLLQAWMDRGMIGWEDYLAAEELVGMDRAVIDRLAPIVTVLLLSALAQKADGPLREILATHRGGRFAASVTTPFSAVATLIDQPAVGDRGVFGRLLDGVLGRGEPDRVFG
jgi:hypothetical protein